MYCDDLCIATNTFSQKCCDPLRTTKKRTSQAYRVKPVTQISCETFQYASITSAASCRRCSKSCKPALLGPPPDADSGVADSVAAADDDDAGGTNWCPSGSSGQRGFESVARSWCDSDCSRGPEKKRRKLDHVFLPTRGKWNCVRNKQIKSRKLLL